MINSVGLKFKNIALTLLLLLLLVSTSFGGEYGGETAASFLKIGIGAKSAGMGGAYTAVAEGANASFWNPANLSRSESSDLILGHQAWLQDIAIEYGSVSFGLNENLIGSIAFIYMGYGDITGYDLSGNSTGQLSAYDMVASLSTAYRFSGNFSAGFTVKMIRQQLDQISASTIAGDFGIQYQGSSWQAGLVLSNFGGKMKFEAVSEKLPTEIRLGLAVKPFKSDILMATDIAKQLNGGLKIANGLQVGFEENYFVRSGWEYAQNGVSWASIYNTGVGMKFNEYVIDYSYTISNSFTEEDHHRFSFGYSF